MSGSPSTRIFELRDSAALQVWREELSESARVGFVPTMGALHEGHGSLVKKAIEECDVALVSIFVNPLQFNESGDLEAYPRTESEDCHLLQSWGAHAVYLPTPTDMYPEAEVQKVGAGPIGNRLEGAARPGHFSGMLTVVRRLFERVHPHCAYFGQKDAQQLFLVREMCEEAGLKIDIRACPTVREHDGLAMSSRNRRLTSSDREKAGALFQAMTQANRALLSGTSELSALEDQVHSFLQKHGFEVEYAKVVDDQTFDAPSPGSLLRIVLAARLGNVRLIDNMLLGKEP
ncbi:MAG: pantoate--beta-alanine ligase [Planctomycetota bacterium]|jgi:pantoate--beta-alanine ligase|nr:pantoate--beta-alanine ligase [Planctomycetota bacterium]MDP6941520.1 pantoate--beta-alanine ligase [Planctomycetota bacterium]